MARAKKDAARTRGSREVALRPTRNQEVGNLVDLQGRVGEYVLAAISPRTRKRYEQCWAKFVNWCQGQGLPSLPAYASTAATYFAWLASDQGFATSSINQAVAAIQYRHGLSKLKLLDVEGEPVDWKESGLPVVLKGIRNGISRTRQIKQAEPLTDDDIRVVLELMRPDVLPEARDAALMVVAYAGCRRRSEVLGLDFKERAPPAYEGDERSLGVLDVQADGIAITLHRSKTNQEGAEPEHYFIRNRDAPRGCAAIANWIKLAGIEPGTPLFRPIIGLSRSLERLSGVPGVYRHNSKTKPWRAEWRGAHVGYFETVEAAVLARRMLAMKRDQVFLQDETSVGAGRLEDRALNKVIVKRMVQVLEARKLAEIAPRKKLTPEEKAAIRKQAERYSGHSGRVGSITSAANRGLRDTEIMRMSGHKTSAMVNRYTRAKAVKDNDFMRGSGL